MACELAQELIDATVGERMHEQMSQLTRADRNRVGTGKSARCELHCRRRPQRDDVTLRTRRVERRPQFANDFDAAVADLVEVIDRGDDTTRARLGGKQALRGVEHEQTGDAYAVVGKPSHCAQCIFDERNLNNDLI
jgi:hypothetical protein